MHPPLIPDSTKTERLIVLVDPKTKARLVHAAEEAEVSLGEYVRRALDAAMGVESYQEQLRSLRDERSDVLAAR
jgi:predicted HicB family RNase H-like nuclease